MSFWATERAAHHGTPASVLAQAYVKDDLPDTWTMNDVAAMDSNELLEFAVSKTDYGEAMRPTFEYLLRIASVRLVLRDDKCNIVATAVGVPLTLSTPHGPQELLLSTMLTLRAIDWGSGLAQRFMRRTFAYTASKGYTTRLFTGTKVLQAATLSPHHTCRRVFPWMQQYKPDALFVHGVVTPRAAMQWTAFLAEYGPKWGPILSVDMLTHPSLFACVLQTAQGKWEHAGVFVRMGKDHVHMLYYGCTTEQRLLKFLRSVSAVEKRSVIVDLFHEKLASSNVLVEESLPSIVLPHSSYTWYAHNLPDVCVNSVPLVGLPML